MLLLTPVHDRLYHMRGGSQSRHETLLDLNLDLNHSSLLIVVNLGGLDGSKPWNLYYGD